MGYEIKLEHASPDKVQVTIWETFRNNNGDISDRETKTGFQENRRNTSMGAIEEVATMMARAKTRAETWVKEDEEAQRIQREYNAYSRG